MKRTIYAFVALVVLFTGLQVGRPVSALDQGNMGTMSPKNTHIVKKFPALVGTYEAAGVQAYGEFAPVVCESVTYCDQIVFNIQYPNGYLESFRGTNIVSFGVRITLTWDDPKANDIDLFIWPSGDSDPAPGAPPGVCAAPTDEKCNTLYPEIFQVVEASHDVDDPSTPEDESKAPIPIFMTVVNDTGLNTGYTLDLQWFLIPAASLPDFHPPKIAGVSTPPGVTASKTPAPFKSFDNSDPNANQPKILIPGKDGKLVSQNLNFYAAGNRLKPTHSGTASWVWISSVVIVGLALLVFAFFVVQRRRKEANSY